MVDGASGYTTGAGGYKKNDNSVCLSTSITSVFFQFLQFRSVRLRQVTSVYVGGTDRGARQQVALRLLS